MAACLPKINSFINRRKKKKSTSLPTSAKIYWPNNSGIAWPRSTYPGAIAPGYWPWKCSGKELTIFSKLIAKPKLIIGSKIELVTTGIAIDTKLNLNINKVIKLQNKSKVIKQSDSSNQR